MGKTMFSVISKIAHWRWYPLMYNTSWLPSYTNNCSQHQWVLNLMRFIIMNDKICIEIEHTNPCSCPENGVSRSRSITCGSLAFLTTLLGKDALLDSRSLTSYTTSNSCNSLLLPCCCRMLIGIGTGSEGFISLVAFIHSSRS